MGQGRRRTSQQPEGSTSMGSKPVLRDVSQGAAEGAASRSDTVYHPDQRNEGLTTDDRKAIDAQRRDVQSPPFTSTSTAFHPTRRSSDSEDEDNDGENTGEVVSETARGLIRWVYDNWYALGWMLGKKGFDIGWSVLKYGVAGGPKPSWGLEYVKCVGCESITSDLAVFRMTVVAAVMRNLSAHSSLADIVSASPRFMI